MSGALCLHVWSVCVCVCVCVNAADMCKRLLSTAIVEQEIIISSVCIDRLVNALFEVVNVGKDKRR